MTVGNLYKTFIESLIHYYITLLATLKKISKDKLKFKEKTWRTSGLQKIYLLKTKTYQSLLC